MYYLGQESKNDISSDSIGKGGNKLFMDLIKLDKSLPKDYWLKRNDVAMKVMEMMMSGKI